MPESEPSAHCSYEGCTRTVHGDTGLCIFHAPADKKDPQEFRNALAAKIRKWREEKAAMWDFRGWVFVDVDRKPDADWPWEKFNLFRRAMFPVNTDFGGAKFETLAYFRSAAFSGDAYFRSAAFSGDADFRSAAFSGDADFRSAAFSGDADFRSAAFSGDADFRSAAFSGDADFESVKFYKESVFKEASFKKTLDLTYASFAVLGDFSGCKILGHVRLLWPGEGKTRIKSTKDEKEKSLTASAEIQRGKLLLKNLKFEETGILDLRDNSLAPDCELAIENSDMSRVLLEGTDCTKIHFYNCEWPVKLGRQMVGDEWLARPYLKRPFEKRFILGCYSLFHKRRSLLHVFRNWSNWRLIELTYQQLAKRYREDFNHPTANHFDCGTFEMRRLSGVQRAAEKKSFVRIRSFQKKWLSLNAFYKGFSNYSASIWRPVIILTGCLLLFARLYRGTTYTSVNKNGLWNYFDYLGLSLQVSYLNRAGLEFAKGNSILVNILMALQVIFVATLVALFLFAVRRRFRHG